MRSADVERHPNWRTHFGVFTNDKDILMVSSVMSGAHIVLSLHIVIPHQLSCRFITLLG